MEKLSDLIVEQLLPGEPRPGHAVVKIVRLLLDDESEDSLESLQWLGSGQSQRLVLEGGILHVLAGGQRRLGELALKQVPGPLQRVLDGVGEIFQGANWYGLLRGVLRG